MANMFLIFSIVLLEFYSIKNGNLVAEVFRHVYNILWGVVVNVGQ